jgi:hypothetical protein
MRGYFAYVGLVAICVAQLTATQNAMTEEMMRISANMMRESFRAEAEGRLEDALTIAAQMPQVRVRLNRTGPSLDARRGCSASTTRTRRTVMNQLKQNGSPQGFLARTQSQAALNPAQASYWCNIPTPQFRRCSRNIVAGLSRPTAYMCATWPDAYIWSETCNTCRM